MEIWRCHLPCLTWQLQQLETELLEDPTHPSGSKVGKSDSVLNPPLAPCYGQKALSTFPPLFHLILHMPILSGQAPKVYSFFCSN
jgi:hypothetical protein